MYLRVINKNCSQRVAGNSFRLVVSFGPILARDAQVLPALSVQIILAAER